MTVNDAAEILRPVNFEPRPICQAEGCDHGYVTVMRCRHRHDSECGPSCLTSREVCDACDGTGLLQRRDDWPEVRRAVDEAPEAQRRALIAFIREQDRINEILIRQRDEARKERDRLQAMVDKALKLVDEMLEGATAREGTR